MNEPAPSERARSGPRYDRLGVFGGTFDPIHYGHLRVAEELRDTLALDHVLFVPNYISPFKIGETRTDGSLRAQMVARAIADNPSFSLERSELDAPGPSYTIDTLRRLKSRFPGARLFFLTGFDAIRDLGKWKEPDALLEIARFVAVNRPGVTEADARAPLPIAWQDRIQFLTIAGLDVSSTAIRERVESGRSIRYLTSPAIEAFVREHGLYRPQSSRPESQEASMAAGK